LIERFVPKVVCAAILFTVACERPGLAPGLDQLSCDGGLCAAPGVIQGKVTYIGTARGDAILLLFDTARLPPPDGNGTGAAAVARVPRSTLFRDAPSSAAGPFSASFTFTQVPSGRSYQIRAFIDASHEFDPFFDYAQQPRAGDPVGGYGELDPGGQVQLLAIPVTAGQAVAGIDVALAQTVTYDPPSFELTGGPLTLDPDMDRPVRLNLRTTRLTALNASFDNAHFAFELDRDAQGNRRSSFGDGLDDVFPRAFLRQLSAVDGQGNPVPASPDSRAIVACRVISTPILPALVNLAAGSPPLPQDALEVLVQPLALRESDLKPLPKIPAGKYQVVVVQRSGQFWRLPNQLGDASNSGTPYYAASQAQGVAFASQGGLPANSVSGTIAWRGDPSIKSGNIVVQAYRDDPYNPPPPVGGAQPVRVQIIAAGAAVPDAEGFTATYCIDGLPQGNYLVQALDDVDGNFSSLGLLRTATSGDLLGAVIDTGTGRAASIAVNGNVTGKDLTLLTRLTTDPPAFEIDPATPAAMPADQVTPVRFDVRTKPLSFPAGRATAPRFSVQLVRDSGGAAVDADHDGLADVWPRVYLVRLDPSDPTGLTQYVSPELRTTRTHVIAAAVDPTPFLPALHPQAGPDASPVVTDKLTIIVRPGLFDASSPDVAPQRLPSPQPGAYRIVLLSQTGQVWQIPNESGSAALDPSVVCPATASSCAPGTIKTQSQSGAFLVGPPSHPVYTGGIAGSLTVTGTPRAAYVFAYAANALPPFARPLSAGFHIWPQLQGGTVSYFLPNLPSGNYVVTAVVDMRGDFAISPALFAIAPGAGNLVTNATSVPVGTTVVTANLTAGTALPQRPSFELVDAAGTALTGDATLSFGGAPSASMRMRAVPILGAGVSALRPDPAGAFVLACDGTGKPVGSSLSIQLIQVADPAGLVPLLDAEGKATVISASLDPSQFSAGTCTSGGVHTAAGPLSVLVANGSARLNLADPADPPTSIPLVAGRYAVFVTSLAKQVWRVPNELQPALLDPAALLATPAATKSLLQTQQVAVNVSP
jgi:uncharacterized protein (DUF2141 family)